MKTIILLIMICLNLSMLKAETIDIEIAKTVAKNFMNTKRPESNNEVKSVESETQENNVVFYAINFIDSGWVMVSADNSVAPILGYSLQGIYLTNDKKPDALIDWLTNYKEQIIVASKSKSSNQETEEKWDELIKGKKKTKKTKSYTAGAHLLDTPDRGEVFWGQDNNNDGGCSPSYHKYCPTGDGQYCFCGRNSAGCGAVAMGQIMWYWQWPSSSSYRTYNWSLMPTELLNSSTTQQEDEISHLLKDCGDATNMTYWCVGSWTTVNNVEDAFKNTFQYKGVDKRTRTDWPSDVWKHLIINEIDNERPVFYRGDKSDLSGDKHFFIIDGYDTQDPYLFHINWGWGGSYNSNYFSLDNLTPGGDKFNKNQMAIVGISPTCTGIPYDITDVGYSSVSGSKSEYARNSISLPNTGKNLTVESGGSYTLSAGNSITLKPGFHAKSGSSFHAFISPSNCSNDCGMQLMYMDNALLKGRDDLYGWLELHAVNANTYDLLVYNQSGLVVYQGAGILNSTEMKRIWNGTGAYEGNYVASLTLRNNCGEKIFKQQLVTVINGKKKGGNDTIFNYNFSENTKSPLIINEIISSNSFKIYPSPSNGNFTIETTADNLPYHVSIISNLGQTVFNGENVNAEIFPISLTEKITGFYIVEIIANKRKYYNKIIIQ